MLDNDCLFSSSPAVQHIVPDFKLGEGVIYRWHQSMSIFHPASASTSLIFGQRTRRSIALELLVLIASDTQASLFRHCLFFPLASIFHSCKLTSTSDSVHVSDWQITPRRFHSFDIIRLQGVRADRDTRFASAHRGITGMPTGLPNSASSRRIGKVRVYKHFTPATPPLRCSR